MIRQKNGADTLYTLHTSRSSGDLLLTNEELPRVASRRREVGKSRQAVVCMSGARQVASTFKTEARPTLGASGWDP